MELRVQEMQLEREMHLFRQNPELFMQSPETITVPVPPRPTNTPPNNGTMSLGLDQLHPLCRTEGTSEHSTCATTSRCYGG